MIKLYVNIKNFDENGDRDSICCRMLVTVPKDCSLSILKHLIEREFQSLHPERRPFICRTIEDELGYALTASSSLAEFIDSGAKLIAVGINAENQLDEQLYHGDVEELVENFRRLITVFSKQLSSAQIDRVDFQKIEKILKYVLHLGFSTDQDVISNLLKFLLNVVKNSGQSLLSLHSFFTSESFLSVIMFWFNTFLTNASFNFRLLELVSILIAIYPTIKAKVLSKNLRGLCSQIVVSNFDLSIKFKKELLKFIKLLAQNQSEEKNIQLKEVRFSSGKENDILDSINFNRLASGRGDDLHSKIAFQHPSNSQKNFYLSHIQSKKHQPDHQFVQHLHQSKTNAPLFNSNSLAGLNSHQQQPHESNPLPDDALTTSFKVPFELKINRISKSHTELNLMKLNQNSLYITNKPKMDQFHSNLVTRKEKDQVQTDFLTKQTNNADFLIEYFDLISETSDQEMNQFVIDTLAKNLHLVLFDIMSKRESVESILKVFRLPVKSHQVQQFQTIIAGICQTMNSMAASVAVKSSLISVLIDQVKTQYEELRPAYLQLIDAIFQKTTIRVDMSTVFTMINDSIWELRILGAKFLRSLTDPTANINYDECLPQFETFLKNLMENLKRPKEKPEFLTNLLSAFSNLCVSDFLRPQIIYLEGVNLLLRYLRSSDISIELQRTAMRGLFNIATKSKELKIKVLSELGYEIDKMSAGDLDSVIKGYLLTLIRSN